MADYSIDVNNAIKYEILNKSDICDFWSDDLEDIVSKYYNFCRESLDKYSERIGIKPNVFVYNNIRQSNAKACRNEKGVFAITANIGLIVICKERFLDNEKLNAYVEEKYKHVADNLDMKVSELAFQVATRFTFYHELAHLLQHTKNNKEFELYEKVCNQSKYSLERHILEINADAFASVNIVVEIIEYLEEIIQKNSSIDELIIKDILIIVGICLLNHIISFYVKDLSFYIDEKKHPHPLLRMINIITTFSEYVKDIKVNGKPIESKREIFTTIIHFYEDKVSQNIFNIDFSQFISIGKDKLDEMINYLDRLNNFDLDNFGNAIDIWNEEIHPTLI